MSTRFGPRSMAVFFAVVAVLLLQPGKSQAHPQLAGRWFAVAPPTLNMSYEFALGEYIGDEIWRGTYILYWGNVPLSCGHYELRLVRGAQATLALVDGRLANWRIANVDFGTKEMTLKGTTYRP
jgi:hypothetical protein